MPVFKDKFTKDEIEAIQMKILKREVILAQAIISSAKMYMTKENYEKFMIQIKDIIKSIY